MPHTWAEGTKFERVVLDVEDRACHECGRRMTICDHRRHPIFTLTGPQMLVCRLVKCRAPSCSRSCFTVSPECEAAICLPRSILGWDVFCWIGHRRFSRHWSVPQIRAELRDTYQVDVSEDTLEDVIARYQAIVAAREQDPQRLADIYRDVEDVVLTIDGLQPEKGHETLYVVRELTKKRVWFGEALVCSSAAEVRRLIAQAREWAERLGKRVRLWMSDKQDAFVSGIAAEFPDVPHRYCQNHFLRDVARPMLEADSHAKVRLRSKVRGLRTIEKELLAVQAAATPPTVTPSAVTPSAVTQDTFTQDVPLTSAPEDISLVCVAEAVPQVSLPEDISQARVPADVSESTPTRSSTSAVVLDYCTVVKGILNDDQGGPLQPPGLRMAQALRSVRRSLERNLEAKKGGLQKAR